MTDDRNEHLFQGVLLADVPDDIEEVDFDDDSTADIVPLSPDEIGDGGSENGGLIQLSDEELKEFYKIVYGASGASEAKLKAYFSRSSRNWDQKCQAGAWNACHEFGSAPTPYASANAARADSSIYTRNAAAAVAGDWYFWSIGAYGHVGGALGGGRVWMCSRHVDSKWGINVGVTTVDRYSALTGARFLGAARGDGKNDYPWPAASSGETADQKRVKKVAAKLNSWAVSAKINHKTTASNDGKRGKIYWLLAQYWGSSHDSSGKVVPRAKSLYPVGFKFDGDPAGSGSRTRKIDALLIKLYG